jgi:hypothetical protein
MYDLAWFNKLLTIKLAEYFSRVEENVDDELVNDTPACGVYIFIHPSTGYFYIGSTEHLYVRRYKHIWHIRNGTHRNSKVRDHFCQFPSNDVYFLFWITECREASFSLEQILLDATFGTEKCLNSASDAKLVGKDIVKSEEQKEAASRQVSELWKDPEYRQRMSDAAKRWAADPENRKKLRQRAKEAATDPEFIEKQRENANKQWSDPDARKKLSDAIRARYTDPEFRRTMHDRLKKARGRKISIDGVTYDTVTDASNAIGMSDAGIYYRIKMGKNPNWFFIDEAKNDSV